MQHSARGRPFRAGVTGADTDIRKLRELRRGGFHAQILTYLAGEGWAARARENERVSHPVGWGSEGERVLRENAGLSTEKGPPARRWWAGLFDQSGS